jgi:predicted  nucleic acid-binding Zn-ribbon protein
MNLNDIIVENPDKSISLGKRILTQKEIQKETETQAVNLTIQNLNRERVNLINQIEALRQNFYQTRLSMRQTQVAESRRTAMIRQERADFREDERELNRQLSNIDRQILFFEDVN